MKNEWNSVVGSTLKSWGFCKILHKGSECVSGNYPVSTHNKGAVQMFNSFHTHPLPRTSRSIKDDSFSTRLLLCLCAWPGNFLAFIHITERTEFEFTCGSQLEILKVFVPKELKISKLLLRNDVSSCLTQMRPQCDRNWNSCGREEFVPNCLLLPVFPGLCIRPEEMTLIWESHGPTTNVYIAKMTDCPCLSTTLL